MKPGQFGYDKKIGIFDDSKMINTQFKWKIMDKLKKISNNYNVLI